MQAHTHTAANADAEMELEMELELETVLEIQHKWRRYVHRYESNCSGFNAPAGDTVDMPMMKCSGYDDALRPCQLLRFGRNN